MTPVAASLMSAIILTTVLTVMWRNHRERWIGLWAIAAALWMLRYLLAIVQGEYRYVPGATLLPFIAIARGYFLLRGSYALARKRFPPVWLALFGADVGLLVVELLTRDLVLLGAPGVPHYALFGGATVWSAVMVVRERRVLGDEAWLVGVGLMGIGITNLTFPWASQRTEMSSVLFLVAHAAQLLTGFGALMVFYGRANAERDSAHAELAEANAQLAESNSQLALALEKALSGYLPICAHCKAIRNERGVWEPLERYFTVRHETAFSHGICDKCEAEHYGELLRSEDRGARIEK